MENLFVDPDISKAKTIDAKLYNDGKFFELCKEKIFAPSWQLIGDKEMIAENGSACPFTLHEHYLDEPLVVTKDREGKISCLSNVCTHRGNLLVYERCKAHQLVCKYHGRRFSMDGKFVSMPEFKEVKDFPTEDDHLKRLPVYEWGNLLFTCLAPKTKPEDVFMEIRERLSWYPTGQIKLRKDLSRDYIVNANWALYCENYLEGFHIPFVHAALNDVLDFGEYTTDLYRYSNLQIGIAKAGDTCFELPSSSPDFGKNIAGYYYWVFPNLMLNFYPWGISVNVVKPMEVNKTKVSYRIYVHDESKLNIGAGGDLDTVEMEDEEVVENVQRGVRSRFYAHGRYSVTREQGTHHFHRLLAEFLK